MIAHHHGQTWNASRIAGSLGVTGPTVVHYLDILEDTFMLCRLQPYHSNLKKRLVKAPKVYIRDSGLVHALLGLPNWDALLGHPIVGASWEGWCVEQILSVLPANWNACYFRTQAGSAKTSKNDRTDTLGHCTLKSPSVAKPFSFFELACMRHTPTVFLTSATGLSIYSEVACDK